MFQPAEKKVFNANLLKIGVRGEKGEGKGEGREGG